MFIFILCAAAAAAEIVEVMPETFTPIGTVANGTNMRDTVENFELTGNKWRERTYPEALKKRIAAFSPYTVATMSAWHFAMMNDEQRGLAYRDALVRAVRPGDTVLEVGTGGGLLALMAGRIVKERGGHVYTVEAHRDLTSLATELVAHNGLAEHVTTINSWSTNVTQAQLGGRPADVVFSETIGVSILVEGQIGWMHDARNRLLAKNARIIPGAARQYVTLVQSSVLDKVSRVTDLDGFDLSPLNKVRDTTQFKWSRSYGISIDDFGFREMSEPIPILSVDFYTTRWLDLPNKRVFRVPILSDGVVHGAYSHFDLFEDADGAMPPMISTHPKSMNVAREMAWGLLYTTVGEEENGGAPFQVRRGETLVVTVWFTHGDPSDVGYRIDVQRERYCPV